MKLINKFLILILLLSLIACSTASARRKWRHAGVHDSKKTWRFCTAKYDGDKAGKGFCYWDLYWTWKVQWIVKKYKKVHLFCKWGDVDCLVKHDVYPNMVIRNKKR